MPRIRPFTFWLARKRISPHAAILLQACRNLPSTANELRWIREHIASTPSKTAPQVRLRQLCSQRAGGAPLQYVLGTQPFGDLEILCRPGVLIPRPETEAYTLELASILRHQTPTRLNVLDICTGTGCIALLLHASLSPHTSTHIQGVDISPIAIALARRNLQHNIHLGNFPQPSPSNPPPALAPGQAKPQRGTIHFTLNDLFSPSLLSSLATTPWDVLISNPPYISRQSFAHDTSRSVRNHEPRLALVPDHDGASVELLCEPEDVFYTQLLQLAKSLSPSPRLVLLEVAGIEQAERVVGMVGRDDELQRLYPRVEIWRDHPHPEYESHEFGERAVPIRGSGGARAVYLCNGED